MYQQGDWCRWKLPEDYFDKNSVSIHEQIQLVFCLTPGKRVPTSRGKERILISTTCGNKASLLHLYSYSIIIQRRSLNKLKDSGMTKFC